jgi:hypothetical protein
MKKFAINTLIALLACLFFLGVGSLLDSAHSESARSLITLLAIMFLSVVCVFAVLVELIRQSTADADEVQP